MDQGAHRLQGRALLDAQGFAIADLVGLTHAEVDRGAVTAENGGAASTGALGLAEVEGEQLGGPAQRPHDASRTSSEVAGVHDAGEDAEVLDQPRAGLVGPLASLARLTTGALEQALNIGRGQLERATLGLRT
jgi:hypothetical protein